MGRVCLGVIKRSTLSGRARSSHRFSILSCDGIWPAEMARVLAANGVIVWYDFSVNNPRNPHVRGVKLTEILELL
jgi:hypothetical protein